MLALVPTTKLRQLCVRKYQKFSRKYSNVFYNRKSTTDNELLLQMPLGYPKLLLSVQLCRLVANHFNTPGLATCIAGLLSYYRLQILSNVLVHNEICLSNRRQRPTNFIPVSIYLVVVRLTSCLSPVVTVVEFPTM